MRDSLGASSKRTLPHSRFWTLLVAVPVLATCRTKEPPNAAASSPVRPAVVDVPDTAGCGMVTQALHPSPGPLLAEFLRRDTAGDFTSSNSWAAAAAICPGHEAGWDTYTIVTGYELLPLPGTADTMKYEITYHVYAEAVDDSLHELKRIQRPEVDTVAVIRTPFGWRIDSPDIPPHISPSATLRIMQIRTNDRAALRQLVPAR